MLTLRYVVQKVLSECASQRKSLVFCILRCSLIRVQLTELFICMFSSLQLYSYYLLTSDNNVTG